MSITHSKMQPTEGWTLKHFFLFNSQKHKGRSPCVNPVQHPRCHPTTFARSQAENRIIAFYRVYFKTSRLCYQHPAFLCMCESLCVCVCASLCISLSSASARWRRRDLDNGEKEKREKRSPKKMQMNFFIPTRWQQPPAHPRTSTVPPTSHFHFFFFF